MAKAQSKSEIEAPIEKKAPAKKASVKKASAETKSAEKKTVAKKVVEKKPATKKTAATKKTVAAKQIYNRDQQLIISADDQYLFGNGTHYDIYKKLGAHLSVENGVKGTYFAVWAPNALGVSVVGSFNGWEERANVMTKLGDGGIWGVFVPGVGEGAMYKFLIHAEDGRDLYKADPFANHAEFRPGTASIVADLEGFEWEDDKWVSERNSRNIDDINKSPMAIYECHIGSFMKHPNGTEDGFYNYREFATRIVEYLKEMKYTHVELMGIAEHPFDGSWGYQVTGYYAPTSRYGEPKDFMYLVNELHKNGIGVILDWVPAHFATDAHGLAEFDGKCIFEHPDPRLGEHPDWGTKIFNYTKPEVTNFLIANVLYWIREFHIDGIRVDAVASMLYLDYGKKDGQWLPNKFGGNKNLDAIVFFHHLNSVVRGTYPGFLTIAEESTAWPHVTGPIGDDEGLGFTYKWNMGWMHDFCEYMKLDPLYRKGSHYSMTFAMTYNESENYILPLSHDEVVHLKCSMVNKMPGYTIDKYANLRVGYTYMFGHAGKKLLFMGQDFAQEREWSEARELDWFLLGEKNNSGMKNYVRDLLEMYRNYPCLYRIDNSWKGFEWMNADDADRSIYSWVRRDETGKKNLLFILNMTPIRWENYMVPVPKNKKYKLVLNSDEEKYAGWGKPVSAELQANKKPCCQQQYSVTLDINPYTALVYEF
ncbi:MAG: 1,4-alpha-glucan branching protein GlgB [Lachnospiraceae bacterium]|nr:1,4-alpha-glucan branching protein GlgB [Lachnospiraceae bacterium]